MEKLVFRKKSTAELDHKSAGSVPPRTIILMLDDIRSMHNVGAMFRTADAFGIDRILLCGYTPVPPHRDIRKTALGAEETVPWAHFKDPEEAVAWCRDAYPGCIVAALEQTHGSTPVADAGGTGDVPLVLVAGNEVGGVSEAVLALADRCFEIPQWGSKHSLNVSVAAGVALYELTRTVL
jgi:tRNA G18 (ribose-2'-O)-methylase SpoU